MGGHSGAALLRLFAGLATLALATRAGAQTDTTSVPGRRPPGQPVSSVRPVDSTRAVFLDENLEPTDDIRLGGFFLAPIQIQTADFGDSAGSLEHPRLLPRPVVYFGHRRIGDDYIRHTRCQSAVVSIDTVSLQCPGTPFGDARVEGRLLVDFRHVPPDTTLNYTTPVLRARVTVSRRGRTIVNVVREYTIGVAE